jgi:Flp pilus assembly protein TadD
VDNGTSSPASPRRWAVALAGLWFAALALRLIYLAELHGTPFFSVLIVDGQRYDAWAQQIAAGNWLGSEVFYQTPLYPYLMACLYKLAGHQVFLVKIVQAVLGASSCVLLAIAGRRFMNWRVGLIAGMLLAIYPEAIFWDGLIQKSSLDLFLMTLLLATLGALLPGPRRTWLIVAGVVMGAFMLNRENARILYPIVICWLMVYFRAVPIRRRLVWAAMVTASTAAVLLPVGVRNLVVGGEFLISTSQLGPNFYIGNHVGAPGTYEPLVAGHGNPQDEREDAKRLAERAVGRPLSPGAISKYWFTRTVDDILRQPGAWVRLMGRKLLLTINAGELVDSESMQEYARFSRVLWALQWLSLGLVLPLAVIGAWITRREWRSLAVLYGAWAGLALSVIAFYVMSRYRFPLVPIALLFAGAAVAAMPGIRAEWRGWIPGALGAAGIATLSYLPMTQVSNATHANVGAELIRVGRSAEAIPLLQEAVRIAPGDATAHYDLGIAFERTGNRDQAVVEFREAVRLMPNFDDARDALASAHLNLAEALQMKGQSRDAIPHYEAGLALKPDSGEAHSNFALALVDVGRTNEAAEHFRTALRLQPDSYGVRANFGDLLLRLDRTPEAIVEYEKAVRLAPADVETIVLLLDRLAQAYTQARRLPEATTALTRGIALARAAGREDLAAPLALALRGRRR